MQHHGDLASGIMRTIFRDAPGLRRVHPLLYVYYQNDASQLSTSVKQMCVLGYYVHHLIELSHCLFADKSVLVNAFGDLAARRLHCERKDRLAR